MAAEGSVAHPVTAGAVASPSDALAPATPVGAGLVPASPPSRPDDTPRHTLHQGLDLLVTSLPTLLMGLLALGSWWLVSHTPLFEDSAAAAPLRHVPDYTMTVFRVQRFAADGRMSAQLEGDTLRHYPDDQTLEIDNPRIRSVSAQGKVLVGTGRKALANADASEVQLIGDAHLVRQATVSEPAVEFRSDFLRYVQSTEQVNSNLPVVLTQGGTEIHADAFAYDNLARTAVLTGRVRAVMASTPKK